MSLLKYLPHNENFIYAGDAWHDMRKFLEGMFNHDTVARCMEETRR